jgi:diguanylate cyclase (GGDEF)-like protein
MNGRDPAVDHRGMRGTTRSKLVIRLAVAGMSLAVVGLGALALWAAIATQHGANALTSGGVQTSGHLRAVQGLSMIDTSTDALEDDIDDRASVVNLRKAQRALHNGLTRMASGHVPETARIGRAGQPLERELAAAIERFLAAAQRDEAAAGRAEDDMEEVIEDLALLVHDMDSDPSARLTGQLDTLSASLRAVRGTALVLVPLGLIFVGVSGWLLRSYRRRSEQAMRDALEASATEARTDQLTGLANRRALLEELERRIGAGEQLVVALADLNGFKQYNDTYGHPAGDALLRRLAGRLADACADRGAGTAARLGGDEFCVIVPAATADEDVRTLVTAALSEEGHGFRISAACGTVSVPHEAADAEAVLRIADGRMYAAKTSTRPDPEHLVSRALLRMLDERHPGLGRHVDDVAKLAGRCATALGLREDDIATVERAAELHDIGKVAIPASILTKPGPLTSEEWDFMRRHTVIGERILAVIPALEDVATVVRASHERWDGTGYPDLLAGERIPIGARIVAIADAFCAMTEDRPYAKGRTKESAIRELRRCAGTQFDPVIVEFFLDTVASVEQVAA